MSRYAESYKLENLRGPGDSRPTGQQIIHDEQREGDLAGNIVIITGCSSGIGLTTAEALLTTGATLYCTARDVGKAAEALTPFMATGRVHVLNYLWT